MAYSKVVGTLIGSAFLWFQCGLLLAQAPQKIAGVISGIVVDEQGMTVAGAEVDADSVEALPGSKALRLALTDDSGAFVFNPIKYGTYKFYALKPEAGYPDTKFELYADSYHKTTATISPDSPNATVKIVVGPKAGRVRLVILDSTTGQAVPNPTLILRRLDTNVWISANETDDSILVPPGIPTQLTVQAQGYSNWSNYDPQKSAVSSLLNVKSGEEINLTVELKKLQ